MKLLGFDELRTVKGIAYSRSHIYRLIAAGKFVKPIHLGTGRIAFVEKEIDEWIKARVAERDAVK
jgi:prophage regulatory protein